MQGSMKRGSDDIIIIIIIISLSFISVGDSSNRGAAVAEALPAALGVTKVALPTTTPIRRTYVVAAFVAKDADHADTVHAQA